MADSIFQAIARLKYPNAPAISGDGAYAVLGKNGIRLYDSFLAMNANRESVENWIKLSKPSTPPRFNPLAAKFRKMIESA
jgi:hypothetical protein